MESPPMMKILERLKTKIFPFSDETRAYQLHHREDIVQQRTLAAFDALNTLIHTPGIDRKLFPWEDEKRDRNLANLTKFIENSYHSLSEESIIEAVDSPGFMGYRLVKDEMVIMLNSFYTTILYDILWASNISVSDVIKLSRGEIDNKNLLAKFPEMIKEVDKEIIPFFKSLPRYEKIALMLFESQNAYKKKLYMASSSLILIVIEKLVRTLGEFLIEKQQIDRSKLKESYNSLDRFLREIPWKKDFKIDATRYSFITGNFVFRDEDSNDEDYVMVTLYDRLHFLKRRFREYRNSIIHGDDIDFGQTWDLYVNYSALNEIYSTIMYYEELYS